MRPDGEAVTIATVLTPGERQRVDAASHGLFSVVHRESLPDAIRVVRERPVDAVLLSVHQCAAEQLDTVGHLVREFPGIPTVAVLSRTDAAVPAALLRLGASGVQRVVDLSLPAGWAQLRQLVSRPATRSVAGIQRPIFEALPDLTLDGRLFWEALVRLAPEMPTVRALALRLRVRPSTLMSRFGRAGLPSPKNYLAAVRLLHAAHLFQYGGLSVADVAYRLKYSSPQSFGRHLRTIMGITSSEFRTRFPFPLAVARFVELMITPYGSTWTAFHPVPAGGWEAG